MARFFLPVLITAIFIFGLYEIIERIWLAEDDAEVLGQLHTVQGILFALLVAGVVGWVINKTSSRFPSIFQIDGKEAQSFQVTEEEQAKVYAQWFIALRWVAILLTSALVLISIQWLKWLPLEVWLPLASTITVLLGFNLLYTVLLRWGYCIPTLLLLQGYIDLGIFALLLHFSGGLENPLSIMMIFHVIIGGILFSRRQCYWLATTASFMLALLGWLEWAEAVPHYTLEITPHFGRVNGELFHPAHNSLYVLSRCSLHATTFFLTAFFVTALMERLRHNERQRKEMARQALADQQLLEQALETTGAGLRVLDHDLRVYWINGRWKEWFVSSPNRFCEGFEILNVENSPARQTLTDGQIRIVELMPKGWVSSTSLSPLNKNEKVFQITIAPLRDLNGNIHQIVELAQDITQQKKTQAQMLQAGKLAAVGELAGNIIHEVNNPISIISAKSRLLLSDNRKEMSPKIVQELVKIIDLADRVARITQGLLAHCRVASSTHVHLDVCVPIRKALALLEGRAKGADVQIKDQLPEQLPLVKANDGEMEQVFLNLFINAMDAMPKGGFLKVSSENLESKSQVGIIVEDTGTGMPEAIRQRIFEPFFTTKQEGRGTGLGLSICLGLVQNHGGEITVESTIEKGSQFIVRLPLDIEEMEGPEYHV